MTRTMPWPAYIDHDPAGQEDTVRRIVDILHLRYDRSEVPDAGRVIRQALGSYRASVTQTVLQGHLTVDQGEELMRIVEKIEAEEAA